MISLKKLVCLVLCLGLALGFVCPVRAEEGADGFAGIRAQFSPTGRITPEHSVVSTNITFQNVQEERSCTLRWYIGDTLCMEDRNFLLSSGAVSSFECSVHFDNDTQAKSVLWVELTCNDDPQERKVFIHELLTKPIHAAQAPDGDDYIIHVIRNQCVVIVYAKDANGEPGRIVNVFTCSPVCMNGPSPAVTPPPAGRSGSALWTACPGTTPP